MAGDGGPGEERQLVCDHCRDVIGAYEPFWLRDPNGGWVRTSWMRLKRELGSLPLGMAVRHLGCGPGAATG